jgi:hypothetical protein
MDMSAALLYCSTRLPTFRKTGVSNMKYSVVMKNLLTKVLALVLVSFSVSCDHGGEGPDILPVGETLIGSWLVSERGYSPGAGYITEEVPPRPAQTIIFKANGELFSNVEGFSQYPYYLVLEHPQDPEHYILALFATQPDGQPLDVNKLSPTYAITFTDKVLKLSYRWCIEGCHIGMKRITAPAPGEW